MLDAIQSAGLQGSKVPTQIGPLITLILPYIFYGAGIGLLVYLIMGGLQLMTSRGDPKAIQAAQTKITNALIGFIVVIFAYILVALFGKVLGISAFEMIFKMIQTGADPPIVI